jgi:signal transduction histidine kinase
MAIAVQIDFDGATLDQYDEVVAKMGFEPGGRGEPGGLFHWATMTGTGLRVTDVWESQEAFERFAREKIGPITASVGVVNEPRVTMYEVHNYLTAG